MVDQSDESLIRQIADGNDRACRHLVERHLGSILSVGRRMLGNDADAEDLAQDVFIRVWRHAESWRPAHGARFSTWLYRVAVNAALDRLRRRRGEQVDLTDQLADPQPGPERLLEASQLAAQIDAELQALPDRQRAALVLAHYHGKSNPEIAELMEISIDAVESLLARARRQLRTRLVGNDRTAQPGQRQTG